MMKWLPGVEEHLASYVYLLTDPRNHRRPFYVGKGVGSRCFAHVHEARHTTADSKGDYEKLATIRAIEQAGLDVGIEVLRHGLTHGEALMLEAAAMDLLGFSDLTNRIVGKGTHWVGLLSVGDVNAQYGATPVEIDPVHRVLLIRIPRGFTKSMSSIELYEATRKWWRVSRRRVERVGHAFAVHGGVVRAVYKITEWVEPTEADISADSNRRGRWGFRGYLDEGMEDRYLFADLTGYLSLGGQNPITYVHC